jgi:hypothetical protein
LANFTSSGGLAADLHEPVAGRDLLVRGDGVLEIAEQDVGGARQLG